MAVEQQFDYSIVIRLQWIKKKKKKKTLTVTVYLFAR